MRFKILKTSDIVMLAARRRPQERAEGSTKQDRLSMLLCILWHSLAEHLMKVQTSGLKPWAALSKQIRGWLLQTSSSAGSPSLYIPTGLPKHPLVMLLVGATVWAGFSLVLGRTVLAAGEEMHPSLSPKHGSPSIVC